MVHKGLEIPSAPILKSRAQRERDRAAQMQGLPLPASPLRKIFALFDKKIQRVHESIGGRLAAFFDIQNCFVCIRRFSFLYSEEEREVIKFSDTEYFLSKE